LFQNRIKEHNKQDKKSAIQTHKKQHTTHVIVANNIEIVNKDDSRFKIKVKEMLHTSSAHNMQQHLKIIKKVYLCLIMETDIAEILKKK
jgi:hypothetical protein